MGKLVTDNFKTHIAAQFVESVSEFDNTNYYVFAGKSLPFADDTTPPNPNTGLIDVFNTTWDDIIFGKKVTSSDIKHMIKRINWESGTVYAQYDPKTQNPSDLTINNFYVVTSQADQYHVFKCLNNNRGAKSTSQPLFGAGGTTADDEFYQTSDGYIWKYMYTISSSEWSKFATNDYVPVIPNANVTANAINGAIESINIISAGRNYNAYATGKFKEISVAGDNTIHSIETGVYTLTVANSAQFAVGSVTFRTSANAEIAAVNGIPAGATITSIDTDSDTISLINVRSVNLEINMKVYQQSNGNAIDDISGILIQGDKVSEITDFYKDSSIYIRSGSGAGQVRTISEYVVTGQERRVVLASAFTTTPDLSSTWEIGPKVTINGDGTGASAIATVNSTANSISTVEVVNRGSGYTFAEVRITGAGDSQVVANTSVLLGPPGGHGSDVINELYANKVGVSVTFSNTESNTISTSNDYRKIGLIKDPLWANVNITLNSGENPALFTVGETVIQYSPQSANTLLQSFVYDIGRYQTITANVDILANSSVNTWDVGTTVTSEDKIGTIIAYDNAANTFNVRLSTTSAAFSNSDVISNSTVTREIVSISSEEPPTVETADGHGLANGTAIAFHNLDGTALVANTEQIFYAKTTGNANTFTVWVDSGLSTAFDNSANSAATTGYVTTTVGGAKSDLANVLTAEYTFTGNNVAISGLDNNGNNFGYNADLVSAIAKLDSNVIDATYTANTFTITNTTLDTADRVNVELYTALESILEESFVTSSRGKVTNRGGGQIRLTNVDGPFSTGQQIKGLTSGTIATVASVDNTLNVFSQLTELSVQITDNSSDLGVGVSGTGFALDERVVQSQPSTGPVVIDNANYASGYVHAVSNTITRFVSAVSTDSEAIVTTNIAHGFSNGQVVSFESLNGSVLSNTEPLYYVTTTATDTQFKVTYGPTYAGSQNVNNSGNTTANSGVAISSGVGLTGTGALRTIYLNNVTGVFNESEEIKTITVGGDVAKANITSRIDADLVDNTGEIIYIETIRPVQRSDDQSEKVRLIIEF